MSDPTLFDAPPVPAWLAHRSRDLRKCDVCGRPFWAATNKDSRLCSLSCNGKVGRTFIKAQCHTPESTEAERVRAQGLINKRIKLGHVERPKACQFCAKPCRTDAHHPDYSQPDLVAFLCRSCHMRAHHNRAFEQQVAAIAKHAELHGIVREAGAA